MAENTKSRLTRMLLSKSRQAQYARVFAVLGVCVAVAVAVILHQNGVAMTHEEQVLTCPVTGTVAHTHDQSCYDKDGNLVCPLPERELHVHTDECYTVVKKLTCGKEESDEHKHTDDCYTVVKELVCGLEESDEHKHTDACYAPKRELTCKKEEITEEHVHGPGCFTTVIVPNDEAEVAATAEENAEQSTEGVVAESGEGTAEVVKTDEPKANEAEADKDVAAAKDSSAEPAKDSDKVEGTKTADAAMPAQSFVGKVVNQDGKVVLQIEVTAPEGAFPANTTMKIAAIDSKDVKDTVDKAVTQKSADEVVKEIQAVDITFFNEAGVEIEPLCPITVSMTSDKIADEDTNPVLVHVDDEGKGEVVDQLSDKQAADRKVETGNNTLAFDADAFSVYVIAYTVDFHWDVDGETYDFSIPGGGFVSFTDLIEVLGIAEGTYSEGLAEEDALTLSNTTVSDKTKKFVADVKSVEFSNPDLVWVGKVETDSTVGDLKKANGLDVQYSAELSEEQIKQINAQTVKSGDWALISKLPFLSEESLTVTMNNGEVFTIKVTDAQDPSIYVGDNKEVIIYDNGEQRAMTSTNQVWDGYRNQLPSIPLEEAETNQSAHWKIEATNDGYYLKSSDGKYLQIKGKGTQDISLVDNRQQATVLTIKAGSHPDYRIYAAKHWDNALYYCDNKDYDGFFSTSDGANYHNSNNQDWLYIKEVQPTPDPAGDWLLYLDDDFDEITIHVGETITLRPYNKWEWKENDDDVQTAHWNIDGKDNGLWDQIDSGDDNGAHKTTWDNGGSNGTAGFHWTAYVKKDTQLETHYWSVQGRATSVGDYTLTNTRGKSIIVHVVDGEPVKKPPVITDTVDIKVNLFDYDRDYLLDPEANNNLANNSNNKDVSTNKMGNGNHFYFMSSGSGNSGTYNKQNDYTQGVANHGIVQNELDREGYPKLAANVSNQSLKYLFDTNKTTWNGGNDDGMIAYPNVNGMFQKDSHGYYYYNSNTNYFYYNASNGKTNLYEHTYTQTSGKDKGSLVNDKPIGFFPFHDYDATKDLYVNQNHNLNHHLGMSMEIPFKMNENKLDEYDQPIIFEFTGDDDLWVFAEWEDNQGKKHSELVLDIGGIHQPVYGYINFTDDKSSSKTDLGFLSNVEYKLKVYYLERGGCDSNLAVRFNLPVTNVGDIPFTKTDEQGTVGLQGAVFGLYTDASCSDDTKVRTATSDSEGHVLFKDLATGTYYMKEITPPNGYQLSSTTYTVEVKAKNKGQTTTINGEQASSENYGYTIQNMPLLGSLQITKAVTVNNQDPTNTNKAKTNGTYVFKVNGIASTNTAGVTHTVKITFADGKATRYQIDDEDEKPVQGTDNTWTVQLLNLTPGEYTIEETAPTTSGMVLQSVDVTPGTGNVDPSTKVATVTVAADDTSSTQAIAQVQFTNNYTEYEVVIVKVDTASSATRLGGAEFDLYASESIQEVDGKKVLKDGAKPINTEKLVSSSTEGNGKGKVTLGSLASGTYYLFETKAPAGYIAMDAPVQITIEESQVTLTQGSKVVLLTKSQMTNATAELEVMNSAGVELPHTGGSGTGRLMVLGMMLVLMSGVGIAVKTRNNL